MEVKQCFSSSFFFFFEMKEKSAHFTAVFLTQFLSSLKKKSARSNEAYVWLQFSSMCQKMSLNSGQNQKS